MLQARPQVDVETNGYGLANQKNGTLKPLARA
jgi:hypothetical protein